MNIYYRAYQNILRAGSYLVKWNTPKIICNSNLYDTLKEELSKYKSILIITDEKILSLGLQDRLLITLDSSTVNYVIYDKTRPNPTVSNVEQALAMYKCNKCEAIIALGGGSSIDCAKGVAARIARPKLSIDKMRGLLKINRKIIPFFAIPTTAGTGSETTIAAVITNDITHEKYMISDLCLVPKYAILDPQLTTKLPAGLTGSTGMDALTHGIEAYIGNSNTRKTKYDALRAIKLIYENLIIAYYDGDNINARTNMQYASFYAGKAFTRAYVGNVHAIAHSLGGLYDIPHGLANAIVLPIVLKAYGKPCEKKLSQISDYIGLSVPGDNNSINAQRFIEWIEYMNETMEIPNNISAIKYTDIELLSRRACAEANPLYPVPVIWNKNEFIDILLNIKEQHSACSCTNI